MTDPTPPYGHPPVQLPPWRRLQPWHVVLIALASLCVLSLCGLGAIGLALGDTKPDKNISAPDRGGVGAGSSPSGQAAAVPTDTPSPTPAASPTPSSTPSPSKTAPTAPTSTKTTTKPPTTHPPTTPAGYPTHFGITPGAFCAASEHYWYGIGKTNGKLYRCTLTPGDIRWRWHPV